MKYQQRLVVVRFLAPGKRLEIGHDAVDAIIPLLLTDIGHIPTSEHALRPGDRVLFFTDGITDRQSPDGTMFDLDRLSAALARHRGEKAADVVSAIVRELEQFSGGQEPDDDQTLLAVGVDA